MRSFRSLIGVALAVALTGCINSSTVIKVKPDGSGTVEQTTLVNLGALKSMLPPGATQTSGPGAVSDADLRRTAERMGRGVRLLSSTPVKENGFEGVKAIFEFDDINQIQVSQGPSMGGTTGPELAPSKADDDPVRFKLTRQGGTSLLTITIQDKPGGDKTDVEKPDMPDVADPMMMGMLKTMFQGFRINIALDVVGSIVKTNADYVSGSRVTLLEMDMAALLEDEAKFKALQSKLGPDASLSAVKPYLKDIKGIKVDGPVITVEFR
ncbi:MAG: hypothetical protein ACRD2A_04100 [Vicinamibacterales bacterium]